ncbi:MAG: serine/threonine-protein kinase, partial [Kofleriaceae bacterium]
MHCPNNNTLVAMLERALDPAVLPELEAHFGGCGACQQVVAALAGSREVSAPSSAATEPEAVIGTTINARYEMKSLLGRGGMGTVYLARDLTLGRDVALKLHRRGSHRERLHREAVAMAKLAHPNVVTVFEIANVDDRLYVAMEYVRGTTLRGWLRAARRSWREIVAMFVQVGAGLVAAHDAGLIHRDFKPENVLVGEDGRARVSDFGLVQFDGAPHEIDADDHVRGEWWPSSGSTQTGALVGTPAYMAPEQLNGHPADARSDQYGFCVTLYEALYRARPSLEGELTFPDDVAPRVPKFLRAIVARGLRTQPSDRFASMVELLAALQVDPTRRRKRVAIVVGGLIAAGAIALGVHAVSSESGAMCQLGDEQFAARWNPERRQAIAAAFAASGVPYAPHAVERVTAMFDRYGERWSEMYRASCEATHVRGDQSEAVLDLRTECLEDRLRAVDALAHALATADRSVVTTAVQAVSELPDIESCGDVARLKSILPPPRDMATRRKVRELEEQLTKARAFEGLARYADAEGIVTPALQQARELGYRPLEARALLLAADIAGGREDATAKTLYQEAVFAGQAGGDLEIVARAAVGLMLAAYVPGRLEDVELWNKMAEAATLRLGEPPHLV